MSKTKIVGLLGVSEISEEPVTKIRAYTISREVDKSTKDFETRIKNLQREYGFDLEKETFKIDDL